MNKEKEDNVIEKGIMIENEVFDVIRTLILKEKVSEKNISEIVRKVLKAYKKKQIDFETFKIGDRKQNKIYLDSETLNIYENIQKGGRSYVVNGLLRT
jgi:23S rRNA maturation-related 3'-5' exoribonuclease YhaM